MAGSATEESGAGRSFEGVSSGQLQQNTPSNDALAEWRSLEQVENGTPSTSPPYWDSDDDDDGGSKPSELYGKYTWKIDKFSQINKRELRSNAFEVGGYRWYILIYPQGCDVSNHLSLFLCVANHDKLLPGWSHFAQFTIAVVNKDPKKSKYSDTLHRFWKKEHDWGWKKFMELSKVLDGFIDADTLIIKAQVQVIRERADRPFHCLDGQYRRELVRVYLSNVETLCRKFFQDRQVKLEKLIKDKARWSSFCAFWLGMDQSSRRRMSREKTESILRLVVKHFFIEKEVTSTLVMDSLYSGLKALEGQNKVKKGKAKYLDMEESPAPIVRMDHDSFVLVDDILPLLERVATESLPTKDENRSQARTKDGASGEEFNKDSIERDERKLTELGLRTFETFILVHIFSKIEVAYQEAVALKRQEELIREEEAAWEIEQKVKRADKEKKSKKKQGKQKRNNRKGKDRGRDDKPSSIVELDSQIVERKNFLAAETDAVLEKSNALEDVSDVSDSVDGLPEIPLLESDDRDGNPINWDADTSKVRPPSEDRSIVISRLSGVQNGAEERSSSTVDDSSSTCSSDSVPSAEMSMPHKSNSQNQKNQKSQSRGWNQQNKVTSDPAGLAKEEHNHRSEVVADTGRPTHESRNSKGVESRSQSADRSLQDNVVNRALRNTGKTEEDTRSLKRNAGAKDVDVEVSGNTAASVTSPLASASKAVPSIAPSKLKSEFEKSSCNGTRQSDKALPSTNSAKVSVMSKPDYQKFSTLKITEKPSGHQVHVGIEKHPTQPVTVAPDKSSMPSVVSRPLSAPVISGPRPSVSMVSVVQTAPILARSVSAVGRLGPESTALTTPSFIPQSYRNAIVGSNAATVSSAYPQNHHSSNTAISTSVSYSPAPGPSSSPHSSDRMDSNPIKRSYSYGTVNLHNTLRNGPLWMESPQRGHASHHNQMQNFELCHPVHSGTTRTQDHLPSGYPAGTSGRQSHVMADEFPHLDIINDLLDDEHGIGKSYSGYHSFSNGPQLLNRHFSFPGDPAMSSGPSPSVDSCRFVRTRGSHDDRFQHGYGAPGSSYDMMLQGGPGPYMNGQVDCLVPNQWQMTGSDLPFMSLRNVDNDGSLYHIPEYQNSNVGTNGYRVYRPSNGL